MKDWGARRWLGIAASLAVSSAAIAGARPARADTFTYVDRDGYRHEIATLGTPTEKSEPAPPPPPLHEGESFPYAAEVREAASLYTLPVELILAVMTVESGFDPRAVSPVGAMGLMQIMPGTAAELRLVDPFDPRESTLGGARYLRILVNGSGGDVAIALAGYHAGAGATQRHGGVPPYPDTQRYVASVLRFYRLYQTRGPSFASVAAKAIRARQVIPFDDAPAAGLGPTGLGATRDEGDTSRTAVPRAASRAESRPESRAESRHESRSGARAEARPAKARGRRVAPPEKPVIRSPKPRASPSPRADSSTTRSAKKRRGGV